MRGLAPGGIAKVVQVEWFGNQAAKITVSSERPSITMRVPGGVRAGEPSATMLQRNRIRRRSQRKFPRH